MMCFDQGREDLALPVTDRRDPLSAARSGADLARADRGCLLHDSYGAAALLFPASTGTFGA